MTAVWTLTGTRFDGEHRSEGARRSVEAAFGNPPDVELRSPIVLGGALLATIPTFVIAVVGAACGATCGGDPWFRATLQAVAVCETWSAVAGVRALFSRRDWIR